MQQRIASIYFSEVTLSRPLYGGNYKIPAVPKDAADAGKPFILSVPDMIQRSQEPHADGRTKEQRRDLIDGRHIARDLMIHWTELGMGMTPECGPGIWIVRDEVAEHDEHGRPVLDMDNRAVWRPATELEKAGMWAEDLKAARARQSNYGDYLLQVADEKWADTDVKQRKTIGAVSREACRYFGRTRPWLEDLKDNDIKFCPYCTKAIPSAAIKCLHCQEVVDVPRYLAMRAELAPVAMPLPPADITGPVRPPVQNPKQQARA